jgi:hypothetical protein
MRRLPGTINGTAALSPAHLTALICRRFFVGDVGIVEGAVGLLDQVKTRLLEYQFGYFEAALQERPKAQSELHLLGEEKGIVACRGRPVEDF